MNTPLAIYVAGAVVMALYEILHQVRQGRFAFTNPVVFLGAVIAVLKGAAGAAAVWPVWLPLRATGALRVWLFKKKRDADFGLPDAEEEEHDLRQVVMRLTAALEACPDLRNYHRLIVADALIGFGYKAVYDECCKHGRGHEVEQWFMEACVRMLDQSGNAGDVEL